MMVAVEVVLGRIGEIGKFGEKSQRSISIMLCNHGMNT
jgi:hypothetical protein